MKHQNVKNSNYNVHDWLNKSSNNKNNLEYKLDKSIIYKNRK